VSPSKENRFVAVAEVVVAVVGQEEDSAVSVEDSMTVMKWAVNMATLESLVAAQKDTGMQTWTVTGKKQGMGMMLELTWLVAVGSAVAVRSWAKGHIDMVERASSVPKNDPNAEDVVTLDDYENIGVDRRGGRNPPCSSRLQTGGCWCPKVLVY